MIPRWLKSAPRRRPAVEPPERRTYAIGDIHGRLDLLKALNDQIINDSDGRPSEIIFLGDYIDRGRESAGVVEFLCAGEPAPDFEATFLKGNHEAALLDFLEDSELGPTWARFGGLETLASYGVKAPRTAEPEAWADTREAFKAALPRHHLEFFRALKLSVDRGGYFFAHAGVNPDKPLHGQSESDLLWIREAFIDSESPLESIIVHGHTPEPEPVWDGRRIGIDTGAYASGRLTAVRIDGGDVGFLSTT